MPFIWAVLGNALILRKLPPLSVTNNNVSSPTATASYVGHNSSTHVSLSGRSWTDAIISNWKGLTLKYLSILVLSMQKTSSFTKEKDTKSRVNVIFWEGEKRVKGKKKALKKSLYILSWVFNILKLCTGFVSSFGLLQLSHVEENLSKYVYSLAIERFSLRMYLLF